jgi:glycosyltransferase involved in cell wall biosynthesis
MRISIALTTHDGAPWLGEQLSSIAAQIRLPDELIACDDCSGDQTLAILQQFASIARFPVRVMVQPKRIGATENFTSSVAAANGDLIVPCDQDDVWYPHKLARIERAFAADPELDLLFSDADVVDEKLNPLGYMLWEAVGFNRREQRKCVRRGLAPLLARFNVVTGAAMAFTARRRDLLLPIPRQWVHDGWIGLLLSITGQCQWIAEPLMAYRQRRGQLIGAPRRTWLQQMEIARRMDAAYFDTLAVNFQACFNRLTSSGSEIPPATLRMLRDKIDHCRARSEMRRCDIHRIAHRKFTAMLRELAHRRYASASLGWKSAVQDLLLT